MILYALIARQLPFDNEHIPTLLDQIKRGSFTWSREIGPTARDLITKMITIDVKKRIKVSWSDGAPTLERKIELMGLCCERRFLE